MGPGPQGGGIRRPSIGITADLEANPPNSPAPRYELKRAYADAVLRAGGLPLVLAYAEDPQVLEAYLDRISGLVVTGGHFDIPPSDYGERPGAALGPLKEGRTAFEAAILKGALARKLPVLGICGGMQLLNVVLGGTLIQDILTEEKDAKNHEQKHDRSQPHHPVEVVEGTLLEELVGKGQLMVNSTHHQAVKKLGTDVRACAVAPDGIIEAVESTVHPFVLGIQWHPELLLQTMPLHLGIYRGFISRARDFRRSE